MFVCFRGEHDDEAEDRLVLRKMKNKLKEEDGWDRGSSHVQEEEAVAPAVRR